MQRNTIFEEHAEVMVNIRCPGDQFILRLKAPKTAQHAKPGQFVQIRVSPDRPLRRPVSIMLTRLAGARYHIARISSEGTVELARRARSEGLKVSAEAAPHHEDDKRCGLSCAAFGIVGLETMLPVSLGLVRDGVLSLPDLLAKMTSNPAKLLNLDRTYFHKIHITQ